MRYAIYYAPRECDLLHDIASRWLGRDVLRGIDREQPAPIRGIALGDLTREPRRYGFHATLKPPFSLAERTSVGDLRAAVQALAGEMAPVSSPALRLNRIGGFFALVPEGDQQALSALAARCVTSLDRLRAPMPLAELARRRSPALTPRQEELLQLWGYPFVLEEFRFHMTLTQSVGDDVAALLEPAVARHFAPVIGRPLVLDAISIFVEPAPGEAFVFLSRFPLTGTPRWAADAVRAAS